MAEHDDLTQSSTTTLAPEGNVFDAINQAVVDEMRHDPSIIMMGENIRSGIYGRAGLEEDRVFDTPLSEGGFMGAAIGAAAVGMRPIVFSHSGFLWVAFDQFVSQAAKMRYMFGGQAKLPVVFRITVGYGPAAHHDARPHSLFMTIPGLKIALPTDPADAVGLLRTALRGEDPVLFLEDPKVRSTRGDVPDNRDFTIPFGVGAVKRSGTDVTVVAIGGMMPVALSAADALTENGVSAEVIDPRTLVPLDRNLILSSVEKTGRLVVLDSAPITCSAASEIAAMVAENGFWNLRAPIRRVAPPDVHTPFSPPLEAVMYPGVPEVQRAILSTFE
jgi:pyruvate/2-oxoglutarate/acetoin dehydrogenase E1 component